MSVLKTCPGCGGEFETGLRDPRVLCRECQLVRDRLAGGGRRLSNGERAAVIAFLGCAVPSDEGVPLVVDELVGRLLLGGDRALDVATLEGEQAMPVPVGEVSGA